VCIWNVLSKPELQYAAVLTFGKKPSNCQESRSYCTVSNSCATCWQWLLESGNFGSSLVHNIFLMYLADGVSVRGSRGGILRGWSQCRGSKL